MTPEQTKLAQQLVALGQKDEKYSWWMQGATSVSGDRVVEQVDGSIKWYCDDWVSDWCAPEPTDIPDLTDPATAGCLWEIWFKLVKNRWQFDEMLNSFWATNEILGEAIARAIIALAKAEGVEP